MFVKTKERGGRTYFFLCIAERGGNSGSGWKAVEYSVCLGETLNLGSKQWVEILGASPEFRHVPLFGGRREVRRKARFSFRDSGRPSRSCAWSKAKVPPERAKRRPIAGERVRNRIELAR